jgi:hypothetical protein
MYVNGKMRPVETLPGMRSRRDKGEFKCYIFDTL